MGILPFNSSKRVGLRRGNNEVISGGSIGFTGNSSEGRVYLPDWDYNDWTFTRTSEASFSDPRTGWSFQGSNETTNWKATNEPRIFSDGAVLIEGASTNEVIHSENLSAAQWIKDGLMVTGSQEAPDTASDGYFMNPDGVAKDRIYSTISTTGSITLSTYTKAFVGNKLRSRRASYPQFTSYTPVSSSWHRVRDKYTSVTGSPYSLFWPHDGDEVSDFGVSGETVGLWGVQYEVQEYETSYIRTSGVSATKAADTLKYTITAQQQQTLQNSAGFSFDVYCTFGSSDSTSTSNPNLFCWGASRLRAYRLGFTGTTIQLRAGPSAVLVTSFSGPTWSAGDTLRVHVRAPESTDANSWFMRVTNLDTESSAEGLGTGVGSLVAYIGQEMAVGSYQPLTTDYQWWGVFSRFWVGE